MPLARIITIFLLFGIFFASCVDNYKLPQQINNRILTVDARVSDENIEQKVLIYETISEGTLVYTQAIEKAKVELWVDNTEKILLFEKSKGTYVLPATFKLKYNTPYKLVFQKADGTNYESASDQVTRVPPFSNLTESFKKEGIQSGAGTIPTHYLSIDIQDPPGEQNNYYWTWRFWEKVEICESCYSGYLQTRPPPDRCQLVDGLGGFFDYRCPGDCWNIYYNTDVNVLQDTYLDGRLIQQKEIVQIPFYQRRGVLVEFKHQNVSAATYRYLKLLLEQTQNTGTLTDTPPSAIVGNIKNTNNPNELIAGSFMLSSSITQKYWLSRIDAFAQIESIGFFGGRELNIQSNVVAQCYESRSRTPIKPLGWIN